MDAWRIVLVVNLALAVGLGVGYVGWGRRVDALDRELEATRARVERLERERQARATGARAGEQQWEARGIVRAVFPQANMLVITHEEIRGLLPARTTSFQTVSAEVRGSVRVGDPIRFSLRGTVVDDAAIVAITPW